MNHMSRVRRVIKNMRNGFVKLNTYVDRLCGDSFIPESSDHHLYITCCTYWRKLKRREPKGHDSNEHKEETYAARDIVRLLHTTIFV